MVVSIGDTTFSSCSFSDGGAKWVETMAISPRIYEKTFHDAPGTNGCGVKRHGFRARRFIFNCIIMGGSENGAIANAISAQDGVPDEAFELQVGGTTFPACELDAESCSFGEPRKTEHGTYYVRAVFAVVQKRLE